MIFADLEPDRNRKNSHQHYLTDAYPETDQRPNVRVPGHHSPTLPPSRMFVPQPPSSSMASHPGAQQLTHGGAMPSLALDHDNLGGTSSSSTGVRWISTGRTVSGGWNLSDAERGASTTSSRPASRTSSGLASYRTEYIPPHLRKGPSQDDANNNDSNDTPESRSRTSSGPDHGDPRKGIVLSG
jgi:hypothetical protein